MEEEKERTKKELVILWTRIVVSLTLALLGRFYFTEEAFGLAVNATIMGIAYLIVAYDVIWESLLCIFKERQPFDEHLLMTIASLGAFAFRFFGPEHNEFLEGVLVMLLYQVGEVFEDLAADKSKEAIVSALDLRDEKARVVDGNSTVMKTPEELRIGDQVILGTGEKILCDGIVVSGTGNVDESSLTGEFLPVSKQSGDSVASGTILKEGSITVRVEKEYKDSTVAKLLDLVQNSADKKSKATRFITRFARIYTPFVTGLALLVAVIPPLLLGVNDPSVWSNWVFAALEFLIVSCPCAIVISVPLSYFAGLGLASKHGVVVKGAEYFDKINELSTVCFDKTGTLTEGNFALSEIHPVGLGEEEFLEYLSAAESRSSHPIAKAILEHSHFSDSGNSVEFYEEKPGFGIVANYKNHALLAGKKALLDSNGIAVEDVPFAGTITYLAVDGVYAGYVVLNDAVRPTTPKMIEGLKKLGIKTMLLSGDKKENVSTVASSLGIDEAHGGLLPEQKQEYIHAKIDENAGRVAFVGDGINDAPSIVLADVGVAMGGLGSDVAVKNADVVLMQDDPSKLVTLIKIAKKTRNRAIFNIAFSLTMKAGIMIASVLGAYFGTFTVPMWVTVLGDTGVALLAVLFALMLGYEKVD